MATLHLVESHGEERMLENCFRSQSGNVSVDDERLSAFLMQWKGVEPKIDFEAAVWCRIRASQSVGHRQWGHVRAWSAGFAPFPAWAYTVAAGIVLGIGLGIASPGVRGGRETDNPLLHSRTLTGSYLAMTTGRTR